MGIAMLPASMKSGNSAGRSDAATGHARVGIVTSSDPRTGAAKVMLQPEGVLTGWLPVLTQWAGSGWGISCPPVPGDQVLVVPQEGSLACGAIVGRLYSNNVRPPDADPGELVIRHASGSSLALRNSGSISIEGDLHVSGDIYDATGALNSLRRHYNSHTHRTPNGQITSQPLILD